MSKRDVKGHEVKRNQSSGKSHQPSEKNQHPFKSRSYQFPSETKGGRKKTVKGLQQVAMMERQQLPHDAPTYLSIETPPPIKPVKKYSDLSGQPASYTDPSTGLHYSSVEEYKQIKRLPSDIVQGYLALRHANRI